MQNLFQTGEFVLNSGQESSIKIECDALNQLDWDTLAKITAERFKFHKVIGIPRGGMPFEEALRPYTSDDIHQTLIVDDVFTTGGSMSKMYASVEQQNFSVGQYHSIIGVVVFARNPTLWWIHSVFQMWS